MNASSSVRVPPIVCLEGPSAVGKTTLAATLARECGASVVPELDAADAPAVGQSASWFVERHAAQWQLARERTVDAPFVVLDGDPFKGLWYNWIYAGDGWEGVDVVASLYRAHVERGTLAFPHLYVALTATEEQLRERRDGDATRTRRNFEKHLASRHPVRHYFAALREAAPGRVVLVETGARDVLVERALNALARAPAGLPDSARLLDHMADWLRSHSPRRLSAL